MRTRLGAVLTRHKVAGCVTGRGSLMNVHFVPGPITTPGQLGHQDTRPLALRHTELLLRGFTSRRAG